jgi:hypothetical protein
MPKIYSKLKASKTKKSFKLPVALGGLTYNIKTYLKYVLKAKVQPRGHLEYKDIVIYAPYLKFKKNKGSVNVLNIFL